MLKKIAVILLILAGAAAIVIERQPAEFHVARSTTISAPAADIYAHINNLQKWESWSPWARLDPNATTAFEGPEEGTGAVMRWSGNHDVGVGSMEIIETRPNDHITLRLDFIEPMKATNTARFSLESKNGATMVTWSMDGRNNFLGKAIGLIMDCETMVGEQFEKGLSNLKAVVEKHP